ncbi:MAG: DoxX family protein [Thiohalomonadales bacterium]
MNSIVNIALVSKTHDLLLRIYSKLDMLSPVANLGLRIWVGMVFFKSGMTKISTWDSTIFLFEYEYAVPFLPPETAAIMAVIVELSLPVFLILGLAGRLSAIALFTFNIIAVLSYPDLNAAGLRDHQVWGLMLLIPLLQGPSKLSLDHLIQKFWLKKQ